MKTEFIPLYSAVISAAIAVIVSWFSSRRTVRLEIDKLRLSTQQLAFSKLLEVRIQEYPKLYAMLSDLSKALDGGASTLDFGQLLIRVNEWDSQHAIFLGPETSNICYELRTTLRATASQDSKSTNTAEVRDAVTRLELALRSDLGIHGFGADLSPTPRNWW
jgi:hypothetical protein